MLARSSPQTKNNKRRPDLWMTFVGEPDGPGPKAGLKVATQVFMSGKALPVGG